MSLIGLFIIGLAAGATAKFLTPQKEKEGWISSLIIGVIGAVVGGNIASVLGLKLIFGNGLIGNYIIATGGAFLVLWIYHKYLADKLNLPI